MIKLYKLGGWGGITKNQSGLEGCFKFFFVKVKNFMYSNAVQTWTVYIGGGGERADTTDLHTTLKAHFP